MLNKTISPLDILCRELHRLDNDIDRLQMLITLKSHLNNLQFTSNTLQIIFSTFNDEQYRLQAINQLLLSIHKFITQDSLIILLKLFTINEYRLNLIEILKNYEPLKKNKEVNEILLNEYRRYFHIEKTISEQSIESIENHNDAETDIPISTTSKVLSSTSGVFEKAKQFVCRVFGAGSSLIEKPSNKRLINEVNSFTDDTERKKLHIPGGDLQFQIDNNEQINKQFQPTPLSLSTSQSYTSMITKSPPPSPISPQLNTNHIDNILTELNTTIRKQLLEEYEEQPIVRQSSMSFHVDESSSTPLPIQSMMVTQIHSILDNIDSVLDKIEAQANSSSRRPAFNENYPIIETSNSIELDIDVTEELANTFVQHGTDQITQTTINIIEHHLNMNDGSGDTTPALIDLLDIIEESSSIMSYENSEEMIDDIDE